MLEKILLGVLFVGILFAISVVDIKKQIIPDHLLMIAVVVRIGYFVLIEGVGVKSALGLLWNGLAISLPLLCMVLLAEKRWKRELLGGGDIKLLFVTGIYLGWERNLWALFIACLIGIGMGVMQRKKEEKDRYFPFGPALSIGAVCAMLIG